MTFLEIALSLARLGFYVHPLTPGDKKPITLHGKNDATTDETQIRAWWTKNPYGNVGIACGASGIAVLDIDHGLTDHIHLTEWASRNKIPLTYFVRSGRRPEYGAQLYFRGSMPDVGEWELDGCSGQVKSLGGYVLAAGCLHPSGETYAAQGFVTLEGMADTPDVVRQLKKTQAAKPEDDGEPITENRNVRLASICGKLRHARLSKDAATVALLQVNEDRCQPPLPADEVTTIVERSFALYPTPPEEPRVSIGSKPLPPASADIELIEELDEKLTATPLPVYPFEVFEGTPYLEFARRAAVGNHIPLEFFLEGALTYVGGVMGDKLHGMSEEITPRMFTVLIGMPGVGKGTTFRRIRQFIPPSRLLRDMPQGQPPPCSVLVDSAGSENGLNEALLKHDRVVEEFEELDRLMEKTQIAGSGGSLMSIVRTCFDDVFPGITTTKTRPNAAPRAYLSLLGGITPDLWRRCMEGRDSYGSGLGGRFNLVASNEDRLVSTLRPMDVGDIHGLLERKLVDLDNSDLTIPTDDGALKVLDVWWNDRYRGKPWYNRVNVITHRKALHLAWLRGLPVITAEVMESCLKLADYLVGIREAYAVVSGEDRTAINENRIMNVLRQIAPKAVTVKQLVTLLGVVGRNPIDRALKSLCESGEVDKYILKGGQSHRPHTVFRLNPGNG